MAWLTLCVTNLKQKVTTKSSKPTKLPLQDGIVLLNRLHYFKARRLR